MPSGSLRIEWFLVRDIEEATGFSRDVLFKHFTGTDDGQPAGLCMQTPAGRPDWIVVFPGVITQFLADEDCIFGSYQSLWTPYVHTLLHELCHAEEVDADLEMSRPGENPHEIIDEFVRTKMLLPLERDILGRTIGDLDKERMNWKRTPGHLPPAPTLPPLPRALPRKGRRPVS